MLSARPTGVSWSALKPDRMLLCQLMSVQKDKVLWPCLLVTTLMNGVRWVGSSVLQCVIPLLSDCVIYIAKDNIKIEFKRPIRCPVAPLFLLAIHEKLTVRYDCYVTFTKCIKFNYLFVFPYNIYCIMRHIKIGYIKVRWYTQIRFIPTYCFGI